jgi:DNA-binding transcriptional ArsR family regulator
LQEIEPLAETETLSIDELFAMLSHPGRRYVLSYLLQEDDSIPTQELVEHVLSKTNPPSDLTEPQFRGQVAARLHHTHLPRLDAVDLIAYDPDKQVAARTPYTQSVEPLLDLALQYRSA